MDRAVEEGQLLPEYEEVLSKSKNSENKRAKVVNILGTDYTIEFKEENEDKMLLEANGYCDYTGRRIVVLANPRKEDDVDDWEFEQKRIIRHELTHAFLCESGLIGNTYCVDSGWAKNEEMIDWFAIQSPKIFKVFTEVGAI